MNKAEQVAALVQFTLSQVAIGALSDGANLSQEAMELSVMAYAIAIALEPYCLPADSLAVKLANDIVEYVFDGVRAGWLDAWLENNPQYACEAEAQRVLS